MGKRKPYRPTGYDWSRKSPFVTLHDPKKKTNRRVQRVRRFGKKQYYYADDFATKKDAKRQVGFMRKRGSLARIAKVHNRHVVYARKSRG